MAITRAAEEAFKVWLALGGVGLAIGWRMLPRRVAIGILGALVAFGALNYARWDAERVLVRADTYDLIHYYLNAKYYPELGYYDLYPAGILVDLENGGPYFPEQGSKYMAQDATGDAIKPIGLAVERGRVVKAEKFTPERWEAFTHDFLHLQRRMKGLNDELYRQMIQDHGFNGTPAWTAVARPIASVVPVEYVKWLCWIDVVLLGIAVLAVWRTYGDASALWLTLFLLVTYSTRWPTMGFAYLRYDYVAALIGAMCALKRGHPVLAGALAGWSAMIRIFPVVWMFGPFAKGVAGLAERRVDRRLLSMAGGFLVACAVLQGLAVAVVGAEDVRVHFENMNEHQRSEELSSRRIGLALALPFRGSLEPKNISKQIKATVEEQRPLRFALAGAVLLALGWGLRKKDDDETFAFGFVPFFLLTTASYYYYVTRVTLVVLHADRPEPRHQFGLAALFALEAFSSWAETAYPGHRVFLIGTLAWGLAGYTLLQTAWLASESMNQRPEPAPEPAAT